MDENRIKKKREREREITGNENDWKKIQGQTTNIVARPSQDKYRKKRMILGEG
jgi:hypothetical protein